MTTLTPAPLSEVFLITGAAGFLGSAITLALLEEDSTTRIVVAVRERSVPQRLKKLASDGRYAARLTIVHGDLGKPHVWSRLPNTITRVIHTAARIERDTEACRRAEIVRDNLGPIAHLAEWAHRSPCVRQIVYASSVSVYGNASEPVSEATPPEPTNLYAGAKLAGEDLLGVLSARGICVTCLRYGSLYGAGMYEGTVLAQMIRQAFEKGEITVFGEGRRMQDFLHVADAARAAVLACQNTAAGIFNIAAGVSISMAELARAVSEAFSNGRAGVRFEAERPEGMPGYQVDVRKAHHVLGFRARYDLATGLSEMARQSGAARSCVPSLC